MRLRHIIPFTLLSILSITSCSKQTYVGSYSFQMGKDKGVHMNATMTLTDEAYDAKREGAKKFAFTVDINKEDGSDATDDLSIKDILGAVYELLGDGNQLLGYYKVEESIEKGKNRLSLGLEVDKEKIIEAIKEEAEERGETPEIPEDIPDIPDTLVESLMYSTIDSKGVYLTIPVSLNDIILQLYWYGFDIYFSTLEVHFDYLPEAQCHARGTHPTADDIAAINNDPAYKEHHEGSMIFTTYPFRDFHTLTIGLLKN